MSDIFKDCSGSYEFSQRLKINPTTVSDGSWLDLRWTKSPIFGERNSIVKFIVPAVSTFDISSEHTDAVGLPLVHK